MSNTAEASALVPQGVLAAYFEMPDVEVEALSGGLINSTFLVNSTGRAVLQRLSPDFKAGVVHDYSAVSGHLADSGWEVPRVMPTHSGDIMHKEGKDIWRLLEFIESDGVVPAELDDEALTTVGITLGRLHESLSHFDYQPKFSLPHFHETSYYAGRLAEVQPQLAQETQISAEEAIALGNQLQDAYNNLPTLPDLGTQLIHGDPQTNNMLFREGKPFTYIDFDTLMQGSPWLDVGDLLRSMVEKGEQAGIEITREQLDQVIEGYRTVAQPNTDPQEFEVAALKAMQHIAVELGMRFMIDVVDDSYFGWTPGDYPSRKAHNLARANVQWDIYNKFREQPDGTSN